MKNTALVRHAALAAVLLTSSAAPADLPPLADVHASLPLTSTTLTNGLRVVVGEDHSSPTVGVAMCFSVGRGDDPPGQAGLAKMIESLLERPPTRHLRASDRDTVFRFLDRQAPLAEAEDTLLQTCFYTSAPSTSLPLLLWLEADRMGYAADGLTTTTVDGARERQLEAPDAPVASRTMYDALERSLFGAALEDRDQSSLRRVGVAEVRARLAALYTPSRAMLVVTGDVQTPAVFEQAEQVLGSLRSAAPERPRPAPLRAVRSSPHLRVEASGAKPAVLVGWGPTPAWFEDDDTRLDILAFTLGSRLRERLVRGDKIADFAEARQASRAPGSYFVVEVHLKGEESRGAVTQAIDEEVERALREPPSTAELVDARAWYVARTLRALDRLGTRAMNVAEALDVTGDAQVAVRRVATYANVDGDAVKSVASRFLTPDRRVVVDVLPNDAAPRRGSVVEGRP